MNIYVNWRTATKAILKNRKRSLLTIFGIVIGIASVITILSIGRGFEKETLKNLTNGETDEVTIQVNYAPSNDSLNSSSLDYFTDVDIATVKQVEGVQSANYPDPDYSNIYKSIYIKGKKQNKQVSLINDLGKEPIAGRQLTSYENETLGKVAMIDSVTAKEMYGSVENALDRGIELEGHLFKIIGIYRGSESESMFSMPESNIQIPKKTYLNYFNETAEKSSLTVTLEKGVSPSSVTMDVIEQLEEKGAMKAFGEYQVFDTALLTDGISKILRTITVFISAVAGISLFIAGVGVMNMMYISVSERTKEIGIRRALGATQNSIRMQFLLEGVTLTLFGGIVGYIVGIGLAYIIGSIIDIPISIEFFTVFLAISVSTGIGLIFSVMPASAAAKKDLIETLR
ncbi:ABC transporter permease [Trichococcus pasteurii]|uniref:Abc transporter permease protein domain n=1 Tax=Trichococcus pasteurii TaxID=43064 RepID=A0A1W1IE11_9LACT|nr:ABC transporter permease [Trichococcus pasteurii]SFF01241.1 putative ABC transport system permease protein [Trichococcus pasteurii]SLM51003.1 abc transporter permease protein domain [Trichococcus pasteurii]SSB91884.1 abc transporter permease protein domain [Trichococcus pasteurii]